MTSADFTIAEFLAWVRTKPAGGTYNYSDNCGCALALFLRETSRAAYPFVYSDPAWRDGEEGADHPYPAELDIAVIGEVCHEAWTFGQLADRLEALLPPLSDTWTRADAYLNDIEDVARERCSA